MGKQLYKKYVAYDGPLETPPDIAAMSKEELEAEFQRLFGEALKRLEAKMNGVSKE